MNKKTLGIITFNRASNYGAILQAYAMKCVCEDLGYEVHVVNYIKGIKDDNPTPLKDFLEANSKKKAVFKLVRNTLSYIWDKQRWCEFVSFRNRYLNESIICATKEEVEALGYDAYIIGSDQIWNYNITGNAFDPVYFGDFGKNATCVLYAASSHDTPFPLDKELEFKELLSETRAEIGIREQKLADYVGSLTGVQYPVVLDPTLLAGRKIMESIVENEVPEKPYILMYQIDANPASDISVKTLEKRFSCDVYTMTVPRIGSFHGRKGTAGPERFLTLLKNAEFLVTNSFHGIALSLLFEKQFYVYENNGVMSRIDGLLDTLKLDKRKVKMVADIDLGNQIDYVTVRERLNELRQASLSYLVSALNGEQRAKDAYSPKAFELKAMSERNKEDCSGCSACAKVCPVNAILMIADEEGFLYPKIDEQKCIKCGLCDKVCGFAPKQAQIGLPKAYGVKHREIETRITSRSGGASVAFSDWILKHSGVIYGASMQKDCTVKHVRAASDIERDAMKTAKYVQSDMDNMYPLVARDLNEGKMVLFSGTPCQIAGLYAYINAKKVKDEKLFTCDLVCHGVPSPKVWHDYVEYIKKKYNQEIEIANFRDKSFGWDSHCESFLLTNGKKVASRDYTDLFYEHIMFRPSCHKCYFANVNRIADVTLADFWGIEKNKPEFNDNKGVSLVLVNTEKGKRMFEASLADLESFECNVQNCMQPTLVKPSVASGRRTAFWNDYNQMPFDEVLKKYTTPLSGSLRAKRSLKQVMYKMGLRQHP